MGSVPCSAVVLWAVEQQVDVGFCRIHRDTSVKNMDQGARGWEGAISWSLKSSLSPRTNTPTRRRNWDFIRATCAGAQCF